MSQISFQSTAVTNKSHSVKQLAELLQCKSSSKRSVNLSLSLCSCMRVKCGPCQPPSTPCCDECDQAGRVSVYIVTRAIQTEPVSTASTGADDKNRTCLAAQLYPTLLMGKWKGSRGAGGKGGEIRWKGGHILLMEKGNRARVHWNLRRVVWSEVIHSATRLLFSTTVSFKFHRCMAIKPFTGSPINSLIRIRIRIGFMCTYKKFDSGLA